MTGAGFQRHVGLAFRRRAGLVAAVLMAVGLAGCNRSLPPNVTPPGEAAANVNPGPAQTAVPEMETLK